MFDLESELMVGGWGGVSLTPLVPISFPPQPIASIKIKDDGHDFA